MILPNLLVDLENFCSRYEADKLPIEYLSTTKKITILTPLSPIHQKLENAMNVWLEEIGTDLTNKWETFSCQTQYSKSQEPVIPIFNTKSSRCEA